MQKVIPKDSVLVPDVAERAFKGQIYDVYQWPQELFDGSNETFEMLKRTDTVSVIAIVNNKILVLNEEQPHLGGRQNFPGGRVDDSDESILAAAKREILEETGYSFKNWRLVRVWQPHTKIEWFVHVLLAWEVDNVQPTKHDPGEKITIEKLSLEQVKELANNSVGYIGDSALLLRPVNSIDDLIGMSEFTGQTVDR